MQQRRSKQSSEAASLDATWQRRAIAAAVLAVREAFQAGNIPPGTSVSRLSDQEVGWVVAAAVFAWIRSRAEQATALGWDTEESLRLTGMEPEPWNAGAVAHILPQLGSLPDIDWTKPIGAWSQDEITRFLLAATKLVATAMVARNVDGGISDPGSLNLYVPVTPNGEDPRSLDIPF